MPNSNYVKGRRKEYAVIKKCKELGMIAFRSAGSHSPIDVVAIDADRGLIRFIQCKPDTMPESEKNKLLELNWKLNGKFDVIFEVV